MGRVGKIRYIYFRVVDINENPVTGLTLANFTVYFTRDGVACADILTLTEPQTGRYLVTYTPSAPGFDFVELFNATQDLRIQDEEEIDTPETFFDVGAFTVDLTQDYGFVGALKLGGVASPNTYTVYLFKSQEWQTGNTAPTAAIAATTVDALGNWVTSPLTVPKDTYHVVAMNGSGSIVVISAFLKVQ